MDKNAIKKFAVWARTELIARVSLKGVEYGITEGNIEDANVDSVGGKVLTADAKKQRQALIAEINDKGYKQVMEEVAYTWFNRFSALRFMEVSCMISSSCAALPNSVLLSENSCFGFLTTANLCSFSFGSIVWIVSCLLLRDIFSLDLVIPSFVSLLTSPFHSFTFDFCFALLLQFHPP